MTFLFKLSQRVGRTRSSALILAAAAAIACDSSAPSSSSPTQPNFATITGAPDAVTDLALATVSDNSVTLSFTEVDDGTGTSASYDIRSTAGSTLTWWLTNGALNSRGTCASPMVGTLIGAKRVCTVTGLSPSTTYTFQLVAFRGTLNGGAVFGPLSNVTTRQTAEAGGALAAECAVPNTAWIWCDDFEQDRLRQYFEYGRNGGRFGRAAGAGRGGCSRLPGHVPAAPLPAGAPPPGRAKGPAR